MKHFEYGMSWFFSNPIGIAAVVLLIVSLALLLLIEYILPIRKLKKSGQLPTEIVPDGEIEQKVLRMRKICKGLLSVPTLLLPLSMLLPTIVYTSVEPWVHKTTGWRVCMNISLVVVLACFICLFVPPFLQGAGRILMKLSFQCPSCHQKLKVDDTFIQGYLYVGGNRFANEHARKFEPYRLSVGGLPSVPKKCPHCEVKLIDTPSESRRILYYKKVRQSSPLNKILIRS